MEIVPYWRFSVFFALDYDAEVHEETFANLHDAEVFASLNEYATVIDNCINEVVSRWRSGRKV